MANGVVDDIERFVGRGDLWEGDDLSRLVARLRAATDEIGDPHPSLLADALDRLAPLRSSPVATRTAHELEATVYPRLWKVTEALRHCLPDGEVRTRIAALDRRLATQLATEAATR